jgi:uncharacterized protein (TIGR02271 family)
MARAKGPANGGNNANRAKNDRKGATGPQLIRSEEELLIDREIKESGRVRLTKVTEATEIEEILPVHFECVDVQHTPPFDHDQGEVLSLPDGSLSVPVFEEQLVVQRTWVVRERVVLRKTTVTDHERIATTLKREVVEIRPDDAVADRVWVTEPQDQGPGGDQTGRPG